MIQDSGERREFSTGAVRDIQEGKGRCDLLPLDVISDFKKDVILEDISKYIETLEIENLHDSLYVFCVNVFDGSFPDMLLEVSKHFEDGAKKYGEYNWQKGIPARCYIDSAIRHYLKFHRGDKDERHDRAFVWNILCLLWTIKHKPEMNDLIKETE